MWVYSPCSFPFSCITRQAGKVRTTSEEKLGQQDCIKFTIVYTKEQVWEIFYDILLSQYDTQQVKNTDMLLFERGLCAAVDYLLCTFLFLKVLSFMT